MPERTAPELAYLETKFAALISYGLTVDLLAEVLPTGGEINVAGVYRNVQRVAERMESELGEEKGCFIEGCQRDWDALPPPGPPITVGLDGAFVHAKGQKSRGEGWFEVIVPARACRRKAPPNALLTYRATTPSRNGGYSN